ncbi:hypothetical protein GALMADRAFT_227693 [Galerina marginata CBS 339.88]|uniref:F-box domain-containing protein n=1 Tax=Galerina marginata (strain CBS 339.88) TaxID=685588 RepID=A0A067SSY1_GALM3|nr:hypothetical protein GALMADRAFT_227693 [Galerina marginata CBS 339.88]
MPLDIPPEMIPSGSPLPLELVEQIFTELNSDDWSSLKACSLLSHTFLSLARKYLFRDVTIALEPDRPSNEEQTNDEEKSSARQFLSFLASNPDVGSCIYSMRLHHPSNLVGAPASGWSTASRELASILPRLTRLHHLIVQSSFLSDWTMFQDSLRQVIIRFHHIPTLHHLELHHLGTTREELLTAKRIRRLTLVGLYAKPETPMPTSDLNPKAAIEDPVPQTEILLLRDLSITLKGPETGALMFSVARGAAATLKSLKWLSSPYIESQDTCIEKIDLQVLPSLCFFAVCVPLDGPSISGLAGLFQGVGEKSKLEGIEIVCDYQNLPQEESVSSWNWGSLDEALTGAPYTTLQEVKITVKKIIFPKHRPSRDHEIHSHEALSLFRNWLPTALARGLFLDI